MGGGWGTLRPKARNARENKPPPHKTQNAQSRQNARSGQSGEMGSAQLGTVAAGAGNAGEDRGLKNPAKKAYDVSQKSGNDDNGNDKSNDDDVSDDDDLKPMFLRKRKM